MADRSKLYEKAKGDTKPDTKSKSGSDEPKAAAKSEEAKGEAEDAKTAEAAPNPFDLLKQMRERHRTERRDAHGAHKSNLDKMNKRHDDEAEEFFNKQMEGIKSGPGVTAEEVAPAKVPAEAAAQE